MHFIAFESPYSLHAEGFSLTVILLTQMSAYMAWYSSSYGKTPVHMTLALFLDISMGSKIALLEEFFSSMNAFPIEEVSLSELNTGKTGIR